MGLGHIVLASGAVLPPTLDTVYDNPLEVRLHVCPLPSGAIPITEPPMKATLA
jgi:hypothetical protein